MAPAAAKTAEFAGAQATFRLDPLTVPAPESKLLVGLKSWPQKRATASSLNFSASCALLFNLQRG